MIRRAIESGVALLSVLFQLLIVIGCVGTKRSLEQATAIVRDWFSYYADKPFSPHPHKPGLKHPEYWGLPGVEGTRISVIQRQIDLSAEHYFGDATLKKTRKEDLIRVIAVLHQHYFIEGVMAKYEEKDIQITFYLSNFGTTKGEYQILNHSSQSFDVYYEDAISEAIKAQLARQGVSSNYRLLRDSLVAAGMKGL